MRETINGILLLDKQPGLTSNGVLQRVKRLFNAAKAGHTGSLDPIATGMLPICFGEATKFSQYLLDANKSYAVVAKLGQRTTTGDTEGEILETCALSANVTLARVQAVAATFLGESEQTPPMFSAVKVNGKPLYELARRGIEIERASRKITIFSINIRALAEDQLHFDVSCSKGTYIRTLVEDLGQRLGCGAHVQALRRSSVLPYGGKQMFTLLDLETLLAEQGRDALLNCLLPVETALAGFPEVQLSTSASFYMRMGQPVRVAQAMQHSFVRLVSDTQHFLGLGEVMADGRIKPYRLLSTASIKEV